MRIEPIRIMTSAAMVALIALAAGCASMPPPNEKLAVAKSSVQRAEQAGAAQAQSTNVMATSPELLIMSLTNSIAGADAPTVCALLGSPAREQFSVSVGVADCASAVGSLAAQVVNAQAYRGTQLRAGAIVKQGDTATVDGCQATWAQPPPGPRLGRFELRRYQGGDRYLVVGYTPCR